MQNPVVGLPVMQTRSPSLKLESIDDELKE
jgi:hypothetical protein